VVARVITTQITLHGRLPTPRRQGSRPYGLLVESSSAPPSRKAAHFSSASRAGQSAWPHSVRQYSTLGGDPADDAVGLHLPELLDQHLL